VRIGLRRIDQAPPPKIKQVHPRITLPEKWRHHDSLG
jgi:hypothetical protein